MRTAIALIAAAALAGGPSAAQAAPADAAQVKRSEDLWATVNVCDTADEPNVIGIRASMPGLGRRAQLYVRFQVQYLAKADGKWHNIESNADSGYVKLGVSRNRVIESGRNFTFLPPSDGGAHTMRGAVTFMWKVKGRTVERLRRFTEGGHPNTVNSDPAGYTAATCQIS
jgi:hypothetical protein